MEPEAPTSSHLLICGSDDNDEDGSSEVHPPKLKRRRNVIRDSDDDSPAARKERKLAIRIPWSAEELDILKKTFANFFCSQTLPSYAIIKEAQKRFPQLQRRTPAQIKYRFQQLIKMRKRETT